MDDELIEAILLGLHRHQRTGSEDGLELRAYLESQGFKIKKAKMASLVNDLKSQALILASPAGEEYYAEILPEGVQFLEENLYLGD